MTLQMAYNEKYREGRATGIVEEKEDTARRMLSSGKYSDSEITGLSLEQIQTLKKSM